jgi:hypothetical protein
VAFTFKTSIEESRHSLFFGGKTSIRSTKSRGLKPSSKRRTNGSSSIASKQVTARQPVLISFEWPIQGLTPVNQKPASRHAIVSSRAMRLRAVHYGPNLK